MSNKKDYPRIKISNDLRHKVLDAARERRKNPTKSEDMLWGALRGKKLDGLKFCRQQPIGMFVVDFYNSELVERDLPAVLDIIRMKIHKLKTASEDSPSPDLGEDRGGG